MTKQYFNTYIFTCVFKISALTLLDIGSVFIPFFLFKKKFPMCLNGCIHFSGVFFFYMPHVKVGLG